MDEERWIELESGKVKHLTKEEMAEGWHWCPEWDYMLVGPGMKELDTCLCKLQKGDKHDT